MVNQVGFRGNCQTTAMGIMPHSDVEKALELSMGLDIPYWPQLPNLSYYEDMYAQASEHFPGIVVDADNKKVSFDTARFEQDLAKYSEIIDNPKKYLLSEDYSVVYHRFLEEPLDRYSAIRGQFIGPVSFGFKVMDENNMPIIYNEQVRALLYDFIQRKVDAQYNELREKNPNAFVWLDEPGLGWVFSGLSGYDDMHARRDYHSFMAGLTGPGALHLCANVNLPYLLELNIEVLSFDAYQMELMPKGYADSVAEFVKNGGIISWGIVPTDSSSLELETPDRLAERLSGYWQVVADNSGISQVQIAEQALLAPARCCLKNLGQVGASNEMPDKDKPGKCDFTVEEQVVDKAFTYLRTVSDFLKERFDL
ncbi:hypothetical protein ACFLVC_01800 [Chloroflexota bacterium]